MSSNTKKRSALGKGLSALLENSETDITSTTTGPGIVGSISTVSITSIEANPFNPRSNFEKNALEELSTSIKIHGIIQPLTVRKLGRDKYQLISGERRFRAAQLAKLTEIPAYIRIANDQAMLEMALVENIQREDLNPIEIALSYQRLIDEVDLTQDQLSQKVSKSRSSITNHLRLLKLPADIQVGVKEKKITMGHARALVSAGDEKTQVELFNRVVKEKLSVRDIEAILRGEQISGASEEQEQLPKKAKLEISKAEYTFKEHLGDRLSTKVDIKKSPNGNGKIVVSFNSDVDLSRIIDLLNK
ncbi:MAG: ParB/RepB/Spo0J family partition protein [Crocinitomicaceae bacterium]|nr:ParB/RepB/Spo0J family partition protein [Crocinitomicaceae bacterium]